MKSRKRFAIAAVYFCMLIMFPVSAGAADISDSNSESEQSGETNVETDDTEEYLSPKEKLVAGSWQAYSLIDSGTQKSLPDGTDVPLILNRDRTGFSSVNGEHEIEFVWCFFKDLDSGNPAYVYTTGSGVTGFTYVKNSETLLLRVNDDLSYLFERKDSNAASDQKSNEADDNETGSAEGSTGLPATNPFASVSGSDASSSSSDSTNNATTGEKNALAKALEYLDFTSFSYSGLIDQLEYEGFSSSEAAYGADHCGADWYEQAAKKAKEYLEFTSFSRQGLIDQLKYEGFTDEQAEYGARQNGY